MTETERGREGGKEREGGERDLAQVYCCTKVVVLLQIIAATCKHCVPIFALCFTASHMPMLVCRKMTKKIKLTDLFVILGSSCKT